MIAAGGDGDAFSIGGNHFKHACRRNVDMTYIIMDNQVYGMTKGQASPTTAPDWTGSDLTPYGSGINPFQPLVVPLASGANFIARCFSGEPVHLAETIVEAIKHPGFSVVQVLSPCVTFRPEQREWKDKIRWVSETYPTDLRGAAKQLLGDDGLTIGQVLYKGDREPYACKPRSSDSIDVLNRGFAL